MYKIKDVFNRVIVCAQHERQKRDDLEDDYYAHDVENKQSYKTHIYMW